MTAFLHLLSETQIERFCKKQGTVKMETHNSEMIATRTCVEHIIDLRTTLRYLGVPTRERT
jgi:hypothetical protein